MGVLVSKGEQVPASSAQALDVLTEGGHLGLICPRPLALLEEQLEVEAVLQAPSLLLADLLPALLLLFPTCIAVTVGKGKRGRKYPPSYGSLKAGKGTDSHRLLSLSPFPLLILRVLC